MKAKHTGSLLHCPARLAFGCILVARILLFPVITLSQETLELWTEVFGPVEHQELGWVVTGLTPSASLPYRMAVSRVGHTGLYLLDDSTDTDPQLTITGGDWLVQADLNDDGWEDIVVNYGRVTEDTLWFYWGTPSGIDTTNVMTVVGFDDGRFRPGWVGDLNNDERPDLVVCAPYYGPTFSGKVYFFLSPILTAVPTDSLVGDSAFCLLGKIVRGGDVNDDGYTDLFVRGVRDDVEDYVDVYWGVTGDTLDLERDLQLQTAELNRDALAVFDMNGDGIDDLMWTARDSLDWVYVHYGGPAFSIVPDLKLADPGIAMFGWILSNAGDMNGDGYDDLAVGCPNASITSGVVLIFAGGPTIDGEFDAAISMSNDGQFGFSVSAIGDVSGDGLDDLVIGAWRWPFLNGKGYWGIYKGDDEIVNDISIDDETPLSFDLLSPYPNPFNPSTTVTYAIDRPAEITLMVYDVLGQLVGELDSGSRNAGVHSVKFDGSPLSSGVYFFRLNVIFQNGERTVRMRSGILAK